MESLFWPWMLQRNEGMKVKPPTPTPLPLQCKLQYYKYRQQQIHRKILSQTPLVSGHNWHFNFPFIRIKLLIMYLRWNVYFILKTFSHQISQSRIRYNWKWQFLLNRKDPSIFMIFYWSVFIKDEKKNRATHYLKWRKIYK